MKPKDLNSPFKWDERHVVICDRVWYIPEHYDKYELFLFPGWEAKEIFGNSNPVYVEYCSGNGSWITAKAQENAHINFVAVEKRFKRARKIWSKIKNQKLNNLFVICGEAFQATKCYFPKGSVEHVFVNFPDPWPKKRHAKFRLIHSAFFQELERVLISNGRFTLVTDDADYSEQMLNEIKEFPVFCPSYPAPYYVHEQDGYGTSYFDTLWRNKGKSIRYHEYAKH